MLRRRFGEYEGSVRVAQCYHLVIYLFIYLFWLRIPLFFQYYKKLLHGYWNLYNT